MRKVSLGVRNKSGAAVLGGSMSCLLAALLLASGLSSSQAQTGGSGSPVAASGIPINHVIVIYLENHSFDNYFGDFPGADGIANAGAAAIQVDKDGNPFPMLPHPLANPVDGQRLPDPRFPDDLPNGPCLFNAFVPPNEQTANQIHAFYRNQYQINGGRMDQYVAWSDAAGMV